MGRALFLRGLAVVLGGFCLIYVGDALIARYRFAYHKENVLSSVTVYYSTTLKNSKVVIFGGQPDTLTCIHAVFSHFGYPTCRSVQNKTIDIE